MKDAELKNTGGESGDWEDELWSYLDKGDGTNCPIYESCQFRISGGHCLSDDLEFAERMHRFIDRDSIPGSPDFTIDDLPFCMTRARIFELVRRLANSYLDKVKIDHPPVPGDIIKNAGHDLPVEIRLVPLKAHHGAVWQLNDSWVIHLNRNDTLARRRFTLYHEFFHILAHFKAKPVFQKAPSSVEGVFNEVLADQFSAVLLMPEEWVVKMWPKVKDVGKMAALFTVPETVMYCSLKFRGLI